ncbi:MAG: hypothetical protein JJ837_08135 [Prochlorococcus marinus XMU1428]|nr:hypothetical protein [Prochlorococcus marinus XMU1428]
MINEISQKIISLLAEKDLIIVGIDGPTASGKTILANNLGSFLKEVDSEIDVQYFRLDWLLKNRQYRLNDLERINSDSIKFKLEGEEHMNLDIFKEFLVKFKVNHFNKESSKEINNYLKINNLYSREDNGKCSLSIDFDYKPKSVIICEGHYTSRPELAINIDINICLLGNKNVLLERKIERVKGYRSPQQAIDYFWAVDVPSFTYHFSRFSKSIDLIIDNSDYNFPLKADKKLIFEWRDDKTNSYHSSLRTNSIQEIYTKIFNNASTISTLSLLEFESILSFWKDLNHLLQDRLGFSIQDCTTDLGEEIANAIIKFNDCYQSTNLKLISDSSVYDEYYRILPHLLSVVLEKGNFKLNLIYKSAETNSSILLSWKGGTYIISSGQVKTSIDNKDDSLNYEISEVRNLIRNETVETKTLNLITPTDFMIPAFIRGSDFNINKIYTGLEQKIGLFLDIFERFYSIGESFLIHRAAKFQEVLFYHSILCSSGYQSAYSFNYLFAINTNSSGLKKDFQKWADKNCLRSTGCSKSFEDYDGTLQKELNDAHHIVKGSTNFKYVGSFIYKKTLVNNSNYRSELRSFLLSPNRHLRKRTFEYLCRTYPDLQVDSSKLIKCFDLSCDDNQSGGKIAFNKLHRLLPSIFAEIYLWMELRGDKSAILGANVYDIDSSRSYDISGLIKSAFSESKPIVIQSSMNALGPVKGNYGKLKKGYLNLEKGSNQLVNSTIACVIKNQLEYPDRFPLYGLGLDHIDAKNDFPKGRASSFLADSLKTRNITHIVLDGSFLFSSKSENSEDLRKAYNIVSSYEAKLLLENPSSFLVDTEYVIGELNYIDNSDFAQIPKPFEMNLFAETLSSNLELLDIPLFKARPSLFVANLGTTHHSKDFGNVDTSISRDWVNALNKTSFVSAVLHGTTGSKAKILIDSLAGCHKVNIAGDFLKVYCNSYPERLDKDFVNFNANSKLQMSRLNKIKHLLEKEQSDKIIQNIFIKSKELLSTLNSPKLTANDMKYFHRSSYYFGEEAVDYFLDIFTSSDSNNSNDLNLYSANPSFSASMIEVPFDNNFKIYIDGLVSGGMKNFHIDVGDGKFISRSFSGLEKLKAIKHYYDQIRCHVHLMVSDPLAISSKINYIEEYSKAGADGIAIHPRSHPRSSTLTHLFSSIRDFGCEPGIIFELDDDKNKVWQMIQDHEIKWIVIMGVPIGYGGQFFNPKCFKTFKYFREQSLKNDYSLLIEADGGLTFDNIKECVNKGASLLSGWSIIRGKNIEETCNNYAALKDYLSE